MSGTTLLGKMRSSCLRGSRGRTPRFAALPSPFSARKVDVCRRSFSVYSHFGRYPLLSHRLFYVAPVIVSRCARASPHTPLPLHYPFICHSFSPTSRSFTSSATPTDLLTTGESSPPHPHAHDGFLSSLNSYRRAFDKIVITDSLERVVNAAVKVNMSGAELIYTILRNKGAQYVFGYPGGAVLPLVDQFYGSDIAFYNNAHEQLVGHAAAAVGKSTGKPGIAIVTSGPGLTNLITPLQDAFMDGVPMIVISAQVPTSVMGTDAFQECPATALTKPCTKWNFLAHDIESLPWALENAFRIAMSGRKGPVHIDCPKNILAGTASIPLSYVHSSTRPGSRDLGLSAATRDNSVQIPSEASIRRVADLINNSKRPVLYVGQGAVDAWEDVRELAVKAQIPTGTTIHGLGIFDELHPLSLHMIGMHGSVYANYAIQNADLILAIGSRFDDRTTGVISQYAPAARAAEKRGDGGIVHFDIDCRQVGKVVSPTKSILGDCRISLEHLLPHIHNLGDSEFRSQEVTRLEWLETVNKWKQQFPFSWEKTADGKLKVQDVVVAINEAINGKQRGETSEEHDGEDLQGTADNRSRRARELTSGPALGKGDVVASANADNNSCGDMSPNSLGSTTPSTANTRATIPRLLHSSTDEHVLSQLNFDGSSSSFSSSPATSSIYSAVSDTIQKPSIQGRPVIITTGVGNHQMMCAQFIRWRKPRQMITSGGLGVMGAGLPFAVGVQVANPDSLVILVDGDGCFNMTLTDLYTVSEFQLPIKIGIMNDGHLQMVRAWQQLFFQKRYKVVDNKNPDYCMLADAYGIPSMRCSRREDLEEVVEKWLTSEGPMLVDFRVVSDICLPMVQPGKALNEMLINKEQMATAEMDGAVPS